MSENIKYYTDDGFLGGNNKIVHGFFTRRGGVSVGPCAGLNCGLGSGDAPEDVSENRDMVAQIIGIERRGLLSSYQVHGSDVAYVERIWSHADRPRVDAMVTDKAGIALGILTADCAPVLFYGKKEGGDLVVGAAHAGWKGVLGGVLDNTVHEMLALGAMKETIKACVGPCIAKASYEVQEDFSLPFLDNNEESEMFFHAGAKEEYLYFDLPGYCGWRLFQTGLKNVSLLDRDTYKNEIEFYSYRRMTHRNEPDYGRQISVIAIKS